jgi:Skp family chaperone for outer membrane proteins
MTKQKINEIITNLTDALTDAEKFDSGNDAAGRRIRNAAQTAKADLQELRKLVQEERNSRKA